MVFTSLRRVEPKIRYSSMTNCLRLDSQGLSKENWEKIDWSLWKTNLEPYWIWGKVQKYPQRTPLLCAKPHLGGETFPWFWRSTVSKRNDCGNLTRSKESRKVSENTVSTSTSALFPRPLCLTLKTTSENNSYPPPRNCRLTPFGCRPKRRRKRNDPLLLWVAVLLVMTLLVIEFPWFKNTSSFAQSSDFFIESPFFRGKLFGDLYLDS